MSDSESIRVPQEPVSFDRTGSFLWRLCSIYMELSKFRLTLLILVTTLAGYVLAGGSIADYGSMTAAVAGTGGAAFGANAFNEWWERRRDGLMERTRNRPLPAGRLSPVHAFVWASVISLAGIALLAIRVNALCAWLAASNILIYVFAYTPLKPRTTYCTLVGAICGAIPPMIGWAAVTGRLDFGAWALGVVLFLWQIPHFMALAWLYLNDYRRGGFRLLPIVDRSGRLTARVVVLYNAALVPIGLVFYLGGLTGWIFLFGSIILGIGYLFSSAEFYWNQNKKNARRLFLSSIAYLPMMLALMVCDVQHHTGQKQIAFQATTRHIEEPPLAIDRRIIPTNDVLAIR